MLSARLSRADVEAAITPEVLTQSRILQIALTLGPLALFLLVSFQSTRPASAGGSDDVLTILTMLDAGILFAALGASTFLVSRLREAGLEAADSGAQAVRILRRTALLRMVFLEGAAMFGIVVLLVAANWGRLDTRPSLWWNTLPLMVLIGAALVTFPSRERFLGQLGG